MRFTTAIIILSLSFCLASAGIPAIRATAMISTVQDLKNRLLPQILAQLNTITLPDISSDNINISNLKVFNFQIKNEDLQVGFVSPNILTLSANNIGLEVTGDYRAKYLFISTHGSIDATASSTSSSIQASFTLVDDHYHFTVNSFNLNIGDFNINIHGDFFAWLLNLIKGLFTSKIKSEIQDQASKAVYDDLTKEINKLFTNETNVFPVPKTNFSVDYTPTAQPNVTSDRIQFELTAYLFKNDKHSPPPIDPPRALPYPNITEKIDIVVSEYLFQSAAYTAFQSEIFQVLITNEMIGSKFPIKLTTDAMTALFPNISQVYGSGKNITLFCYLFDSPDLQFKNNDISGKVDAACDFNVVNNNGSETRAVTVVLDVAIALNAEFKNNSLVIDILNGDCQNVTIVDSTLQGDVEAVRDILDLGIKLGLPVIQEKILDKGFPIPPLPMGITLNQPSIIETDGSSILEANAGFQTKEFGSFVGGKLQELIKKVLTKAIKKLNEKLNKQFYSFLQ